MKTIDRILSFSKNDFNNKFANITAKIASVFSVFFALSITIELKQHIDTWLFIVLSIFIVFFLIVNEVIKVTNIWKLHQYEFKNLITFIITFTLSLSLSGVGIYLWVNKSEVINNKNIEHKIISQNQIRDKYKSEKDFIVNSIYESTEEYSNLNNDLNYWKSRRGFDVEDTKSIRENISRIETTINNGRVKFNNDKQLKLTNIDKIIESENAIVDFKFTSKSKEINKNDFLTYILFTLVIIVEFSIIYLNNLMVVNDNKLKSKIDEMDSIVYYKYIHGRKLLENIYLSSTVNDNGVKTTSLNKAKYSMVYRMMNIEWEVLVDMYNILMDMNILVDSVNTISNVDGKKGDIVSIFNPNINTLDDALKQYDKFYEIVFA